MQVPALTAIKLSIVLFYRRIFIARVTNAAAFHYTTLAFMICTVIWGISFFFAFLLMCAGDSTAYWTTLVEEKESCIETVALHNIYGISDALFDILVMLLPLPSVSSTIISRCRPLAYNFDFPIPDLDSANVFAAQARCSGSLCAWLLVRRKSSVYDFCHCVSDEAVAVLLPR